MSRRLSAILAAALVVGTLLGCAKERSAEETSPSVDAASTLPGGAVAAIAAENSEAARVATTEDITASRQNAITRAVAKVVPSVVGINVTQIREVVRRSPFFDDPFFRQFFPGFRYQEEVKSLGSGFIISPDGYVVTNEHVVNNATAIVVTLPDRTRHEATLVGGDYITDLALLKIDGEGLPAVKFGDSDDVIIGEWVIALGNPFGLFDVNARPTVTVGVISSVDMDFGRQRNDRVYQDMLQTDAAINPGNSGGPLVNSLAEVIGVNTFIFTESSGSIGLGFAIPVNRVKRVIEDLRKYGQVNRRFVTGLEVEDMSYSVARYLGLRSLVGVIVTNVERGSPADRAGLEPGDVILEINDQPIRSKADIWAIIENGDLRGGDKLKLKVYRDRRVYEIELELQSVQG
jgi:serine protease Do